MQDLLLDSFNSVSKDFVILYPFLLKKIEQNKNVLLKTLKNQRNYIISTNKNYDADRKTKQKIEITGSIEIIQLKMKHHVRTTLKWKLNLKQINITK